MGLVFGAPVGVGLLICLGISGLCGVDIIQILVWAIVFGGSVGLFVCWFGVWFPGFGFGDVSA